MEEKIGLPSIYKILNPDKLNKINSFHYLFTIHKDHNRIAFIKYFKEYKFI